MSPWARLWRTLTRGARRFAGAGCMALAAGALTAGAHADTPACPPSSPPLPTPEQTAAWEPDAPDRGVLWRLDKGGRTSWLYGTVHVGRQAWTVPGPAVRQALASSDRLAVEIDVTDPALAADLQRAMARDPALPLAVDLAARLRAQLERGCLPPDLADRVAPELLAALLAAGAGRAAGLGPAYGLDLALIRRARARGQPVHSLETPAVQIAALLSRDAATLDASLDAALGVLERDEAAGLVQGLAEAWAAGRDGDLADPARWCRCTPTAAEQAQLQRLLDGRNPGLADAVDRLHAGGSVFAAMGALHLLGPLGVPALLAQRGYAVARQPLQR